MAFAIHRWLKITHIEANVQHNFWHHVICDKWGQHAKAFAKPTLFVNESANAECCSYIRYDSNFIYHNIPMVGRLSLSQSLLTLKYSMQIAFCVHRKSHFIQQENGFCRLTKLFFLYRSFDSFKSSTCHNVCEFFICLFYAKSFHINEDDS